MEWEHRQTRREESHPEGQAGPTTIEGVGRALAEPTDDFIRAAASADLHSEPSAPAGDLRGLSNLPPHTPTLHTNKPLLKQHDPDSHHHPMAVSGPGALKTSRPLFPPTPVDTSFTFQEATRETTTDGKKGSVCPVPFPGCSFRSDLSIHSSLCFLPGSYGELRIPGGKISKLMMAAVSQWGGCSPLKICLPQNACSLMPGSQRQQESSGWGVPRPGFKSGFSPGRCGSVGRVSASRRKGPGF